MAAFGRLRRGTPVDWLVLGLGNPGARYAGSRHNVGADAVHVLANELGARLSASGRDHAEVDRCRIGDLQVALAVPSTFMNESGQAAGALTRRLGLEDPTQIVVLHDELDIDPGRIKVKAGGGLAGHNGLKSIKAHLKTDEFLRVRIGVGKPPGTERGASYVLRPVPLSAREELDVGVGLATDATRSIITDGVDAAMGTFNARR